MCRVLGITQFDFSRHKTIVARFCELANSGIVMAGDPPGHMDGWGLALYEQGRLVVHKSGTSLLEETDRVLGLLRATQSSPLMILHLRKSAWKNTSNTRHAHPFHQDDIVFFHNGVVYDYQSLLPVIKIPVPPPDARDTEVFFYHVLSRDKGDLGQAFHDSIAIIKRNNRYSALNCLFSEGKTLYAYRDYAMEPGYYTLYKAFANGSWLICSEPLDESVEWQMMDQEEFLALEL